MSRTLINLSANLTGLTFPVLPVLFDNEVLDTAGAFNPADPGEIVVPAGMTIARFQASIRVPDNGATGGMFVSLYKNGVQTLYANEPQRKSTSGYVENITGCTGPWQPVTPGDIFTIRVNCTGLGSPTSILAGISSWFSAEFAP